jgi:hypothetical protein
VSRHGQTYLLDNQVGDRSDIRTVRDTALELVFELVRRRDYQEAPSRFTCVFACETVADVKAFAATRKPSATGQIYEVFAETYYCVDMNWLRWASPIIGVWSNAFHYWSRKPSPEPSWEYLLPLPVRYGVQVDQAP